MTTSSQIYVHHFPLLYKTCVYDEKCESVENELARIAIKQYGLITTFQLRRLGFTATMVTRLVQKGHLIRVRQGLYSVGHLQNSREAHMMAAVLSCGDGALLTGTTALEHYGLLRYPSLHLHIVVPHNHRSIVGIRIHRSRNLHDSEKAIQRLIPTATVARCLIDCASDKTPSQIANILYESWHRSLFDEAAIKASISRNPHTKGISNLKLGLSMYLAGSAGTKSTPEDKALAALCRGGLEHPLVNSKLVLDSVTIEVDFLWPNERICVEIDGPGHQRPKARQSDRERDALLNAHGYRVLRFTTAFARDHPYKMVSQIRRAFSTDLQDVRIRRQL